MSAHSILDIPIDPEFQEFLPPTLLRLGYLYPELDFAATERGVVIRGDLSGIDREWIKREVRYQVYREKIFQQTLSMRRSLYKMLAG